MEAQTVDATDLCELHKQPLKFLCRHSKCLPEYYAFGCDECLDQMGLHRHSHHPKYRQPLEEYLKEIGEFFYEEPHILELIGQTKIALAGYRCQSKFYRDHYNRLFDMLRIKAISRLPREGSEELETLLNLKERRLCRLKQLQLSRLEGLKEGLMKKDSNTLAERRYTQMRQPLLQIIRKFRINYEQSNPDLLSLIRIDRQLQEIEHPKHKLESMKELCPAVFRAEANAAHIFKPLERYENLLDLTKAELQITSDANFELRMESYKHVLALFINEAYNIQSVKLVLTDSFLTKDKVALLRQFLIEMCTNGRLKDFTLLNKEAISGINMPAIQQELASKLPVGFRLRIAYFYS